MIDQSEETNELEMLRSRGKEAVSILVGRYRQKLMRMIALRLDRRILGKVESEDVLQDAYVEAARRLHDYLDRPSVPFFVWLRRITSQILIDTHRRYLGAKMRDVRHEAAFCRVASAGTHSACLAAQLADSLTTPSQSALRRETVAELRAALESLEEIDREVLVLRHLEELSNNEVAQILGIDKSAASKRYLRALERLRNVMLADNSA
ncbi:MAG: sigma-70 family RNA polymerase sigma factor [Pirellulales bacterium]|nr:sigma-70 family RNA polymerase sigma factor [Pirellulales bacterium]